MRAGSIPVTRTTGIPLGRSSALQAPRDGFDSRSLHRGRGSREELDVQAVQIGRPRTRAVTMVGVNPQKVCWFTACVEKPTGCWGRARTSANAAVAPRWCTPMVRARAPVRFRSAALCRCPREWTEDSGRRRRRTRRVGSERGPPAPNHAGVLKVRALPSKQTRVSSILIARSNAGAARCGGSLPTILARVRFPSPAPSTRGSSPEATSRSSGRLAGLCTRRRARLLRGLRNRREPLVRHHVHPTKLVTLAMEGPIERRCHHLACSTGVHLGLQNP